MATHYSYTIDFCAQHARKKLGKVLNRGNGHGAASSKKKHKQKQKRKAMQTKQKQDRHGKVGDKVEKVGTLARAVNKARAKRHQKKTEGESSATAGDEDEGDATHDPDGDDDDSDFDDSGGSESDGEGRRHVSDTIELAAGEALYVEHVSLPLNNQTDPRLLNHFAAKRLESALLECGYIEVSELRDCALLCRSF